MPVKLFWSNPNKVPTQTRIHRSTVPDFTPSESTVIATISDGSTMYDDAFPELGEVFYYVFEISNGSETLFSSVRKVVCDVEKGPGPKYPVMGDEYYGYYGQVSDIDLGIFIPDIPNLGAPKVSMVFEKIAYQGKILFISPIITGSVITTAIINAKLFAHGFTPYNGNAATSYGEEIVAKGRRYSPRLPRMFNDQSKNVITDYGTLPESVLPFGSSELVDIASVLYSAGSGLEVRRKPFSVNKLTTAFTALRSCDFSTAAATSIFTRNPTSVAASASSTTTTLTSTTVPFFLIFELLGSVNA